MPILSSIGRNSHKHRMLVGGIYVSLLLGALTMVYPLLLMIAGATKSGVDQTESRIIPSYLYSDAALYMKHIEGVFNENSELMRSTYDVDGYGFANVVPPHPGKERLIQAWDEFVRTTDLPSYSYSLGYVSVNKSRGVQPHHLRAFKSELRSRYGGEVASINAALQQDFIDWNAVTVFPEDFRVRRGVPTTQPFEAAYESFKRKSQPIHRYYFVLDTFYKSAFLKSRYTQNIAGYNAAHGTNYSDWSEVQLPRNAPNLPAERADWEEFVREVVSPLWIRADATATGPYHAYLAAKYSSVASLNLRYQTAYRAFDEVTLPGAILPQGVVLSDWLAFLRGWQDPTTRVTHQLSADSLALYGTEHRFQDWLLKKYGSIEALNADLGTSFKNIAQVLPPQQEWHFRSFAEHKAWLRWELTTRNFRTVLDYVLLRGRGVFNTVVYCALAVLGALIVNPLAAYALSRYKPASTYKLLLFLMITMAFPPMVTQIPAFLLVRDLQLLNTFWALILPGLANGYSIFLLKGFFDSLPHELYESAALDGAGEIRIFLQITMSLSKPILAVIALAAFTAAYSNFMFALLICQDRKMWTISVWLYQLQSQSGTGLIYASLLVAAIPTFVIFVLCQKVIMRGIVVPVEK